MHTLSSAAHATGKSKSTIFRAIKSGKLSASIKNDGTYQIDPAELHRVFSTVSGGTSKKNEMKQSEMIEETVQTELLRELVETLKNERDDLRRRLDNETAERVRASEEIRRLTLMLMPPPAAELAETSPGTEIPQHQLSANLHEAGEKQPEDDIQDIVLPESEKNSEISNGNEEKPKRGFWKKLLFKRVF